MNAIKVAAALRALADAFEADSPAAPAPGDLKFDANGNVVGTVPTEAPVAPAAPKPRGRPPKAAAEPVAAPAPAPAAADPFDAPPAPPAATLEDVRAALTALKDATSQDNALSVLDKAGGVRTLKDLSADKYAAVVAAAKAAMPSSTKAPAPEPDPFETEAAAPRAKAPSLEDVKAAVVAAQKRTATDTVQKVVMDHGGKVKTENGYGPSLKAIPVPQYQAVIDAINALPATK